jgi:hypothetical protein
MEDHDPFEAVMWREGNHRCELWKTGGGYELRVYVSDELTYREPVRFGTGGLRQAAQLLANAQAAIHSVSFR